jgi:hypothetical protein
MKNILLLLMLCICVSATAQNPRYFDQYGYLLTEAQKDSLEGKQFQPGANFGLLANCYGTNWMLDTMQVQLMTPSWAAANGLTWVYSLPKGNTCVPMNDADGNYFFIAEISGNGVGTEINIPLPVTPSLVHTCQSISRDAGGAGSFKWGDKKITVYYNTMAPRTGTNNLLYMVKYAR